MDFQSAMETFAEAWVAANTKTNLNDVSIQNEALALTRTTSTAAEQTSTASVVLPTMKVELVQQQSPPMSTQHTNDDCTTPEQQQYQHKQQQQQSSSVASSRIRVQCTTATLSSTSLSPSTTTALSPAATTTTTTTTDVLPNLSSLTVTLRTNKTHELNNNNNNSDNCDGECNATKQKSTKNTGALLVDDDEVDQQTMQSTSPVPALPTCSSSSSSSSSTSICKMNTNKTTKVYEHEEEDDHLDHDLRINTSNNNCTYDLSKNACGKSIPVHCVVETIYSIDDTNYNFTTNPNNWRRPIVEVDSYVIIPVTTYFHELVQVALNRLGYSPDSSSAAKGSIIIKNWKALTFDKIADNPLVTVGDILGELTTIATLKIQVYRSRPTYASDIKDKLLRFFLIQSRNMLLSTGCPLDELTLTQLCRGPNTTSVGITNTNTNCNGGGGGGGGGNDSNINNKTNVNKNETRIVNNQYELSDDDRRKFDQWWTSQLSPTTIQRAVVAAAVAAHAQQQQQHQSITSKSQHSSNNSSVTAAAIVNAALSQQYSSTNEAHSFNDTENNLLYSNLASYNARILLECQSNQQSTATTTTTITTTATATTTTATTTTNNVAAAVLNAAAAAAIVDHSGQHHPTHAHIHPALQTVQNQYPNQKTRMRTSFDPELELPKLQSWFSENQHPSRQQIQHYVKELNNLESRRGRKPLDINNVVYWFKNARAAQKRAENRTMPAVANHLSMGMANGYNNHSTIDTDHSIVNRSSSSSLAPSPSSRSGGVSIKSSLMHALNAAADNYIHHQRRHDDAHHQQMMMFKHSNPATDLTQAHNLSMSEELSNGESDDAIDDDVIDNTDHDNDRCSILSPIGPLSLTTTKKNYHQDNQESDRECRTPRSPTLVSPTIINEHIKNVIKSEMIYQKNHHSPTKLNDNAKRNNLSSDNNNMDAGSDNDDHVEYDNEDIDNDNMNDDNNNSDNINNSDNVNNIVNSNDQTDNDHTDNENKIKQETNILDNDTFYKLDLSSRTTKSSLLRNYQHHYHHNGTTPPLSASDAITDDRTSLDRLSTNFPLVPNSMFSHSIMYMSHYIPGLTQHSLHHHPHHGAHVPHTPHAHTQHHQHQPTSLPHNLSTNPMNGIGNNSLSPNINTLQALTAAAAAAAAAAASSSSSSVSVSVSDERRKRNRTFIDPVTEVPRLEQWFSLSTHPSHNLILKYTEELNRMPYRQKFPRLEPKNVQFWFKNRRAKCKRLKIALYDTNVHSQYNNTQCKQD